MISLASVRELARPQPAGGAGAPTIVKLAPNTQVKIAAGCNASACFACELRAVIEQALRRDPRLVEELDRDAEERNAKKKRRAKEAKHGSGPLLHAAETPEVAKPFDLTILGLRRANSLSDDFDDRMVVFCRLPIGSEAKEISEATGSSLLDALEKAAGEAKASVRVVSCSGAPWLVALFTITTDAGMQRRLEDVRSSLEKTKKQIASNQEKLDKARQRKKQVDETELPKAKSKLDEANEALTSAQEETTKAKDDLDGELRKSKKDRPVVKTLLDDIAARRKAETDKKKAVGDATRVVGRLTRESADLGKSIQNLESAGQALEKQKAAREKEVSEKTAALDKTMVHVCEGKEGWTVEGRAMVLPGHYREAYSYFIHHSGGEHFASDTSLTALTVGFIPGLRLYSKHHICANPGDFIGKDIRVGEIKSASGGRKFLAEKATLVVAKDAKGVSATVHVSTGEQIALKDRDVVLLEQRIGGTNIHRAHNARLAADGTLHGDSMTRVSEWSWGCQTFPDYKEFNLFLRLCSVAKRWKCASAYHVKAGDDCAVLQAGEGDALGPGEEAMVARFGKDLLDRSGDINRAKHDAQVLKKQHRINELTWNDLDEKDWNRLTKLKARLELTRQALGPIDADKLERLETKRSGKRTDVEQKELDGLLKDREKWRREYLREKTKRLAADHLRTCDLRGKCNAHFSYTLVEVTAEELARIETAFHDSLNREWNGKLI